MLLHPPFEPISACYFCGKCGSSAIIARLIIYQLFKTLIMMMQLHVSRFEYELG